MANTTKHQTGSWDTFHNNGPFELKTLHQTFLETKSNMPSILDRYNDAATEMQSIIKSALENQEGFRAYGSAWSLSHIAHQKDNMQFNGAMNLKKPIDSNELHPATGYLKENLYFFQCGNVIKEISNFLFDRGKSINCSGASNGQTIAGCVSTGVHGSALDFGAMQDSVVGINLIIGDKEEDIVYLERHTQPALNDDFAKSLNARVIRNDGLFNAALVGLGAFGFIHGIVLEVENRFLLNRYVKKIKRELALELAGTMDFENSEFMIPGELNTNAKPDRPFHYKVFINPYVNDPEYVVEVMYKKPYRNDYPDPIPKIKTAIYRDLLILFTKIAENHKNSIPKLISLLRNTILPKVDLETTGTLAEIFWDAPYQGPAFACAVGIDHKDSPRAMEVLADLAKTEGPVPGIYAMRFVKQSKATLAFTRFPITCMLEIDGMQWNAKKEKIISLDDFCKRTIEVLQENDIPFTQHWGKNANWKFPFLIHHMYGDDAKRWMEYRSALLRKETAALFSNPFLEDTALSTFIEDVDPIIAATIV